MLMKQLQEEMKCGDTPVLNNNCLSYQDSNESEPPVDGDVKGRTRDVVILYANTDLDTKVASDLSSRPRAPNQYVETVVYNGDTDSECSDVSDVYTKEDFRELCMINNETIDFINNITSSENPLCHKHSNIKLKTSGYATDYRRQFSFKNQLNELKNFNAFSSVLPTSLLDYMCCQRPDDDYNFYMDNLITYVQYTIEQLKRISNGEYLTDVAKEKWKETRILQKKERKNIESTSITKAVTIPFEDNKVESFKPTWNKSITHSEMNMKFLNKLLEKKIVLEIPRLFCGSFTLFGKRCQDKLIIQCKKDKKTSSTEKKEESKMIIALELKNRNLPLSRENSKFILQSFSAVKVKSEPGESSLLALEDKSSKQSLTDQESKVKIVKLDAHDKQDKNMDPDLHDHLLLDSSCTNTHPSNDESNGELISHLGTDEMSASLENYDKKEDKTLNPNILACALQKLHAQSPVHEEIDHNQKKKIRSPTRVRIKSPYENKSFMIDEKKRKRLLEIRERREKKKIAMSKNFKISKNKYGQGSIYPQASNSVTKLSITNKSFYNSIYGQTINSYKENKHNVIERKKDCFKLKDNQSYMENLGSNSSIPTSPQRIDHFSDYLEITDTQVQHTNEEETTLINMDAESVNEKTTTGEQQNIQKKETNLGNYLHQSKCPENLVPVNSSANLLALECSSKSMLSTECRKSIDKIYDLMKELVKTDDLHTEPIKNQDTSTSKTDAPEHVNLITSPSHSSTNLELSSSNHSSCSFEKCLPETSCLNDSKKNSEVATNYPKAIVTSRLQTVKFDEQSIKKNRQHKISENPLKAISQLIHRFDDVQRSRKTTHGLKPYKKPEDTTKEDKNNSHRSIPTRNLKSDRPLSINRHKDHQILTPKEKKSPLTKDIAKTNQHNLSDSKNNDKVHEKKIADLIDEVKEMRGEAVRGPKQISRLDTLAQPKKFHFDAHTKEHRIDYGRNTVNKTPHRNISQIPQKINSSTIQKNKQKKIPDSRSRGLKTNTMPSEERARRSASNSPEKQRHSPEKRNISSTLVENDVDISTFLKKKNVGSYISSHSEQATSKLKNSKVAQKSRVPMVPDDVELASLTESPSADESTSLGNSLHFMVDEMMNIFPSNLNVVNECDEYLSQSSQISNEPSMTKFKSDEVLSGSDYYPIDVFEDKNIVTAVESTSYPKNINVDVSISSRKHSQILKFNERTSSSLTELEKLENALTGNVGGDNFRNKLRIKNLTPTQSMQQIFVLQSGDTGSLVVESTLSQKIHTTKPDILSEIHTIQTVSRSINWNSKKLPMLCFPVLQSIQYNEPYCRLINKKIKPESLRKEKFETSQAIHICNPNNISESTENIKLNTNKDDMRSDNSKSKIIANDFMDINITESQARSENIDNTTSMDVLVGLLNEIKNISTYQSNVEHKNYGIDNTDTKNIDQTCYQNQISFTALDKLRKLESDPSMYSHYISSNDGDWHDNWDDITRTAAINNEMIGANNNNYTDKEITANIKEKEIVHRFTDVPSQLFPMTVDQSTSVSSIVAIKNRLFRESIECVSNDYKMIYTNFLYHKDPKTAFTESSKQSETDKVPYREVNSEEELSLASKLFNSQKNTIIKDMTADPILKLKRDVLVIVYSMLVFTVFAALTFPNILRML